MSLRWWAVSLACGFQTFVLRQKRPRLLGMVITDTCNLDCFYCESKNSGRYHFTYPEARRALEEAYVRGHRWLYFTGGEPMIWEDGGKSLIDLARLARGLGFLDVFIFTNGTRPLSIENCSYVVTVDGPREAHNRIRQGTYDRIMENVRGAATRAVFASITLTKANVALLEDFVRETTALGIFRGVSFNFLTHWPEILQAHGLSPAQRTETLDRLWRLKQEGHPVVLSRAAYLTFRRNDWKRPIPHIELCTKERVFLCCRDVDNPSICENCGYANCVEVSQILALKPSAAWQALKMVRGPRGETHSSLPCAAPDLLRPDPRAGAG